MPRFSKPSPGPAGHCSTAAGGQLALYGMVFTRDGGKFVHSMEFGPLGRAAELGAYVAGDLLRKGARDLIAWHPPLTRPPGSLGA